MAEQPGLTGEMCKTCGAPIWAMGFRCTAGCQEDNPRVVVRRKPDTRSTGGWGWEISSVWSDGGRYGNAPWPGWTR